MNVPLRDVGRLWTRCVCSVVINMGRHDNYSFSLRIDVLEGEQKSHTYWLAESLIVQRWPWHNIIVSLMMMMMMMMLLMNFTINTATTTTAVQSDVCRLHFITQSERTNVSRAPSFYRFCRILSHASWIQDCLNLTDKISDIFPDQTPKRFGSVDKRTKKMNRVPEKRLSDILVFPWWNELEGCLEWSTPFDEIQTAHYLAIRALISLEILCRKVETTVAKGHRRNL